MKKLLLSISTITLLASCGGEPKSQDTSESGTTTDSTTQNTIQIEKVCKKGYDKATTTIGFGGFKTTEKKEVKGVFNDFTIDSTVIADTPEEIFANAVFSVTVRSIETKDKGRNRRIRDEYFGNMASTRSITGKVISFDKDSSKVNVELTLNEITNPVALDYTVSGDSINLSGNIDILDFDGSGALKALNEVCEVLHKGSDGVSKTWSDVNLYISSVITEACE